MRKTFVKASFFLLFILVLFGNTKTPTTAAVLIGTEWVQESTTGDIPKQDSGMVMAYDPIRHRSVLTSGLNNSETYAYYGYSNSWKKLSNVSPCLCEGGDMVYVDQIDQMLFFGYESLSLLNRDTSSWLDVSFGLGNPQINRYHKLAYDQSRSSVYLFGGEFNGSVSNVLLQFNITSWTWSILNDGLTNAPTPRGSMVFEYDPIHNILVMYGGYDGAYLWDFWTFDMKTMLWTEYDYPEGDVRLPNGGSATCCSLSTVNPSSGEVLIYSGIDQLGPDSGTYVYKHLNLAWFPVSLSQSPPELNDGAMAFDSYAHKVIIHGGFGNGGSGDETWSLYWHSESNLISTKTETSTVTYNRTQTLIPSTEISPTTYSVKTEKVGTGGGRIVGSIIGGIAVGVGSLFGFQRYQLMKPKLG